MSFFKKRISPAGIVAHFPKLAKEMGVEEILSAIAEQVGVSESEIPKKAKESVWAFQMFMVTRLLNGVPIVGRLNM